MNTKFFEEVIYKNVNNRLKESFIRNNYLDFYRFIENKYEADSFLEKLFIFYKGRTFCYACNKKTTFISFKKGYLKYCSVECASNSIEVREKYKKTCLEKYGHNNVSKSESIKVKKKEKNLEKFGVSCHLQSESVKKIIENKYGVDNVFKLQDVQNKIKKTNLEKYGVDTPLKSNEVRKIYKQKLLEKYGVDSYSKTKKYKDTMYNHSLKKIMNDIRLDGYEIISKSSYINVVKHKECNQTFEIQTQLIRKRYNSNNEICMICNPHSPSMNERALFEFIKSIGYNPIKYRDKKFEIDVFLEDLNIGFEFNGLYWHSELFKDKYYHFEKYHYFREKGIQVYFIYEDDWQHKRHIIKSIIKSKLKITERRIYARKCQIQEIDDKTCKYFLNNNHIQGWCVSKFRYGLFLNTELVAILTVGKKRINLGQKDKQGDFEILRYCSLIDSSVIGGFSKLLNHFLENNSVQKIITYADCSLSNGELYYRNGFNFLSFTEPNYYYFSKKENKKINRFNFTKQKLVKMGFNPNSTEKEIMFDRDYFRIYDSGSLKFELTMN